MKSLQQIKLSPALQITQTGYDGGHGYINFKTSKRPAVVVWSFGGGWEHVSVSFASRCPTWEEMCQAKDMFWLPEECVVQYHSPASEYVNQHPYCLHLWRPIKQDMPMPPRWMVGLKG